MGGFALLVAVVFSSVLLALGLALGSLAYKQQILASNGTRSQYAFYAAEAAFECALLEVQKAGCSDPYRHANDIGLTLGTEDSCNTAIYPTCGGVSYTSPGYAGYFAEVCYNHATNCPNQRVVRQRFPIAFPNPTLPRDPNTEELCAEVTVYEAPYVGGVKVGNATEVFAQGYDLPCNKVDTTSRIVARGIQVQF